MLRSLRLALPRRSHEWGPDATCVCVCAEGGARRAAQPRARDMGASIWMRGDEEGPPGGEGAGGDGGGEGGAAEPRRWEPRAVFNTRRDPCLAEARQFIRSRRPAPRVDDAAGAAAAGAGCASAAPPPAGGPAAAEGTASRWGVKRLRTTLVSATGDEQGAGAAAAGDTLLEGTTAPVTQQLDSAPTSDNEHAEQAEHAMLMGGTADEAAATKADHAMMASMLLGAGDGSLLVDFPWASADAGPGAWDGAGALLA